MVYMLQGRLLLGKGWNHNLLSLRNFPELLQENLVLLLPQHIPLLDLKGLGSFFGLLEHP